VQQKAVLPVDGVHAVTLSSASTVVVLP